jgi:hypothetical protein
LLKLELSHSNKSDEERENLWTGMAFNALIDGDAATLGFSLQRLRDWSRVAPYLTELFLGSWPYQRVEFKRKRRGNPVEAQATLLQRHLIRDAIEQAEGRNFKEKIYNAGVSRRTAFRARKSATKSKN